MPLHPNDRSFVLSTEMFDREHNCKFWEENAAAIVKAPQSVHQTLQSAGTRETFGR